MTGKRANAISPIASNKVLAHSSYFTKALRVSFAVVNAASLKGRGNSNKAAFNQQQKIQNIFISLNQMTYCRQLVSELGWDEVFDF